MFASHSRSLRSRQVFPSTDPLSLLGHTTEEELDDLFAHTLDQEDPVPMALAMLLKALRASYSGRAESSQVMMRLAVGMLKEAKTGRELGHSLTESFARMQLKVQISSQTPKTWAQFLEIFHIQHPSFLSAPIIESAGLTAAESRVCMLLAKDHNHHYVTSVLGISAKTLNNHRKHIREKLGLRRQECLSTFLQRQL